MSRYHLYSRGAYYAVVASIPLLVVYELLLVAGAGSSPVVVRNAADAWLRLIFIEFGVRPTQVTLGMILILILSLPIVRRSSTPLRVRYFMFMFAEATAYSLVLGILIQGILGFLLSPFAQASSGLGQGVIQHYLQAGLTSPAGQLQNLALSLGAGLFEELVFRVLLLALLMAIMRVVLAGWLCVAVSIVTAAILFSLAHHVGPLGEPFDAAAFLFRFVAGLLFTILYYARGFAVTAYAHALYDIRILLL